MFCLQSTMAFRVLLVNLSSPEGGVNCVFCLQSTIALGHPSLQSGYGAKGHKNGG